MAAIQFGEQTNLRKKVVKRLVSGQTITLTQQDEKMLRAAYDYMQGFSRRTQLEAYLSQKRQEVAAAATCIPQGLGRNNGPTSPVSRLSLSPTFAGLGKTKEDHGVEMKEFKRLSEELASLEDSYSTLCKMDSKISIADLESILQQLGIHPQKRVLEHMLYEVDEMADGVICWDEFQLTYLRNVSDVTGNEPCSFFRILEFVTFDPHHKGTIMEDDVMEVLFIRLGAGRLEAELKGIYGNSLRALGGRGTLTLEEYLSACLQKTGRRALVT